MAWQVPKNEAWIYTKLRWAGMFYVLVLLGGRELIHEISPHITLWCWPCVIFRDPAQLALPTGWTRGTFAAPVFKTRQWTNFCLGWPRTRGTCCTSGGRQPSKSPTFGVTTSLVRLRTRRRPQTWWWWPLSWAPGGLSPSRTGRNGWGLRCRSPSLLLLRS